MTTQSSAFKSQSLNFVVETSVHLATALPTASSVLPPPEVWGDRVHPLGNMALPTMVLLPTMGILPTNYGFTMVYWQSHQKLCFFITQNTQISPWAAFASANLDPSCTMFRAVEVFKEMCRRSMSLVVTNRPISCQIPIEFICHMERERNVTVKSERHKFTNWSVDLKNHLTTSLALIPSAGFALFLAWYPNCTCAANAFW